MNAAARARRAALVTLAVSGALAGCDRMLFYLNVDLPEGTTSLQVDSFVDGASMPSDSFTVTVEVDGGLAKQIGFEVSRSAKTLTVQLTAFNADNCSTAATWSGLHSGHLDQVVVGFTRPFMCVADGGAEAGADAQIDAGDDGDDGGDGGDGGGDDGNDDLRDGSDDTDATTPGDARNDGDSGPDQPPTCPAPADPDAGFDADADAGAGDPCATYCQQVFAVCPAKAFAFFASVPDCRIKCAKIAWPIDTHAPALSGNTINCRLHYLETQQCEEVTPLGGFCGSICENYRHIVGQTCGVADAACNSSTIQADCIRTALNAARDPAWCAQASHSPDCAGCAP